MKRFRNEAFDWAHGRTCIHLARYHARAMGHKVPKVPPFRDVAGAKRVLAKMGHESTTALLDAYFERRQAPAFIRLGDLATVPGEHGMDAVLVCAGAHKLIGWHALQLDKMAVVDFEFGQLFEGEDCPEELRGKRLHEVMTVFEV